MGGGVGRIMLCFVRGLLVALCPLPFFLFLFCINHFFVHALQSSNGVLVWVWGHCFEISVVFFLCFLDFWRLFCI